MEVKVSAETVSRLGRDEGEAFISILDCENALSSFEEEKKRERALARRADRLPADRADLPWADLTVEERRVLLYSQKEFNSFRASLGGTAAQGAEAAPAQSPAQGSGNAT